ncbi:EAL domain-containing protein [Fusibacter bizertensis]
MSEKILTLIDTSPLYEIELEKYILDSIFTTSYFMVYQEQIDSSTFEIVGIEALARLNFRNHTLSPNLFIPIIESSHHIHAFGLFVIENIFKDLVTIHEKYGEKIKVSINVSPLQLINPNFPSNLEKLLRQYDVNPQNIVLEITENIKIADFDVILESVTTLRAIGVLIALDDFGVSTASLMFILNLPIDIIKIDKSLIALINEYKFNVVIKSIIDIAKISNVHVVAEGVETIEQIIKLQILGCNIVQGYFFSKPDKLI